MLTKRIVIVSPSRKFRQRALPSLVAAGATVDLMESPEKFFSTEGDCALLIVHFDHELTAEDHSTVETLLDRLGAEGQAVVVIPTAHMKTQVRLLRLSRCNNVLVESSADPATLAGVAARHLFGDIFGLEKYLSWGVRIYSMLVGDYAEKSMAIATISNFASSLGVRRKYIEHIEKVVDELLMNALYDAPEDDAQQGEPPTEAVEEDLGQQLEKKALIQYSCDGEQFAISVRDNYGSLQKNQVLNSLERCLKSDHPIDQTEGGVGLGLYIIANTVSEYTLNLQPGVATEAICLFDLDTPQVKLKNFGVFTEKMDAKVWAKPSRPRPRKERRAKPRKIQAPMPLGLKMALGAAILLLLVASGILLWKDMRPVPRGRIAIKTTPPGAKIRVDGTLRGTTDDAAGLLVERLEVDKPHVVRATKEGYKDVQAVVQVLADKTTNRQLRLEPLLVKVGIRSRPGGAQILLNGKPTGKKTPTTLSLPPHEKHTVRLKLLDYEPSTKTFETQDPGERQTLPLIKLQPSTEWGSLRILTDPPGAEVILNGKRKGKTTPVDNLAVQAKQPLTLELRLTGHVPHKVQIQLRPQEKRVVNVSLPKGGTLSLQTWPPTRVYIDKQPPQKTPLKELPLPAGSHEVEIRAKWPYIQHQFRVKIGFKKKIQKKIRFGTVSAARGFRLRKNGRTTRRLGLLPGTHRVKLVNTETGEVSTLKVKVKPGQTVLTDPPASKSRPR